MYNKHLCINDWLLLTNDKGGIFMPSSTQSTHSFSSNVRVTVYNLSSDDLRFLLAAGYEPIRNRILKLTDGYYIYDAEEDDYVLVSR